MASEQQARRNLWTVAIGGVIGIAGLLLTAGVLNAAETCMPTLRQSHGWHIAESPNFRCWTCQDATAARNLAVRCEELRDRLGRIWGLETTTSSWTPRCEIVVHSSRSAYGIALSRPGDSSVGSTRIQFDGERAVARRIDLRCDAPDWTTAALPHELTHVLLADRFQGRPLPPWADEGIAMLNECESKRTARLADLQQALRKRTTYSLRGLLGVRQMPPAHLRDAFYSQSLVLTSWLIERTSPQEFLSFLEACQAPNPDEAWRRHLSLAGIDAAEQVWNQRMQTPRAIAIIDVGPYGLEAKPVAMAADD